MKTAPEYAELAEAAMARAEENGVERAKMARLAEAQVWATLAEAAAVFPRAALAVAS